MFVGSVRSTSSSGYPLQIFMKPIPYRITAWVWPALLIACVVLTTMLVKRDISNGWLVGAIFAGIFCVYSFIHAACNCYQVRSVRFIYFPCCLSEQEQERIRLDCRARTSYFVVPDISVQETRTIVQHPQ
ncbi:Hypothetical_protein [Hexamita inflata]|uniref:Hypothetical_protein n=1 Tax=Hexamita inflata TaxID=28002 RepID=A0ABP1GE05_9EUKA